MSSQDVFLKLLVLAFLRVYYDIKITGQRNETIMILSVFPRGCCMMTPPFSLQEGPSFPVFVC